MKKNKVEAQILKKRLLKSLLTGIFFFIIGISSFLYIQNKSHVIDGAPALIHHSFDWNEKVWAQLFSKNKLSVKKSYPAKGTSPRVNGDIGLEEDVDLKNYAVEIESGNKKMTLPLSFFHTTAKVGYSTDFRCIEGWSEVTQYAGARFSDFIKMYDLGKKADGSYYAYVGLETPDREYYVSIDIESMLHPQTVLAYEMNEAPLSKGNGAPIRLMIPIKYGIKSIKRIGKIFFSDTRPPDYWAEKGYDWYSGF